MLPHADWAVAVQRALAEPALKEQLTGCDRVIRRCQRRENGDWHQSETLWLKALLQLEAGERSAAERTLRRLLRLVRRHSRLLIVPDCQGCATSTAHSYPGFGSVARTLTSDRELGAPTVVVALELATAVLRPGGRRGPRRT